MSRETRIGILSVIAIAVSIWGYKFIKGQNILSAQQFFYVEYDDVGQMMPSSPVTFRGFQIGTVTDIFEKVDAPQQKVVVEMEVKSSFKVPKNAIAEIRQTVMGDKSIAIVFNDPCVDNTCADSGDFLNGIYKSIPNSIMTPDEMDVYMERVSTGLQGVTKDLDKMMNDPNNAIGKSMTDLQATMANLRTMSNLVNKELRRNGKINDILEDVNGVTASIDPKQVQSIVGNANTVSSKFNEVDLKGISATTTKTLTDAQDAIKELTATMKNAQGTIDNLNKVLDKINKGEGSLGKLANDEKLYDEIKDAAYKANVLMSDIQQRPNRYIPFKSSRKVKKIDKKNPLVLPEPAASGNN